MEIKKEKNKTKYYYISAIIATVLAGTGIIGYFTSLDDNMSIKLSIAGIGVTILIAIIIFLIQTWMSTRITKLTTQIHNMTNEYQERRKQRIQSLKNNIIDLQKIKLRYRNFSTEINEFLNSKKQDREHITSQLPFIEADVDYAILQIETNREYTEDYINNITLVDSFPYYLSRINGDFTDIKFFYNKNIAKEDLINIQERITEAINVIDEFIQEIEKEPL